jgi:hypothetical protein
MHNYEVIFPLQDIKFPPEKEDGWMHLIQEGAIEVFEESESGWKVDDTTYPFWELNVTVRGVPLVTKFLVAKTESESLFTAAATLGEDPSWKEVEKWQEVIEYANNKISEKAETFSWTALIGQIPQSVGRHAVELDNIIRIEELSASSSEKVLFERSESIYPSLVSHTYVFTVPIKVEGKSSGYYWDQAEVSALKDLHRLSAILTLEWDILIDVRERPRSPHLGEVPIPDSPSWCAPLDADLQHLKDIEQLSPKKLKFPQWGTKAWATLKKEPKMESATASYMEGWRIRNSHPSLATVAFIASIEAIASKIFEENRCPACKNHKDITKTFKETLRLATNDIHVINRLSNIYSQRSKTVHAGKLHGAEGTSGFTEASMLSRQPQDVFKWFTVDEIQKISRTLLKMGLLKELPARKNSILVIRNLFSGALYCAP